MSTRSINLTPFKRILVDWEVSRGDYRASFGIVLYKTTFTRDKVKSSYNYTLGVGSSGASWHVSGTVALDVSGINEHAYISLSGSFDPPDGDYPGGKWTFNNLRFLTD